MECKDFELSIIQDNDLYININNVAQALRVKLTESEIEKIENLAKTANINIIRYWEKEMK